VNEVHQHPDRHVIVRAGGRVYIDTPENFALDFAIALPPLPAGANEQIYTQGKRNAFMGDGNVIDGGPMPWDEGDRIIANVSAGLAKQAARRCDPSQSSS
jgi:hypothetical protein